MSAIWKQPDYPKECAICGEPAKYILTLVFRNQVKTNLSLCEEHKPEQVELLNAFDFSVTISLIAEPKYVTYDEWEEQHE